MKIAVSGYTYIRKNLFEVWEHYPKKDDLVFILPRKWKAKGGEIVYYPPKDTSFKVYQTTALFWHSHYPVIKGLLKGWMPFLKLKLIYLRLKGVKLLFTASEPNLLTTVINAAVARCLGMKHVFNFWDVVPSNTKPPFKKFIYDTLVKWSLVLSQGAVCGSEKSAEILKSYNGNIKIAVFPTSGLDSQKFNPQIKPTFKEELGLQNKTVFLFAGVFNRQKGVDYLIEAFSQVVKELPDSHLLLVGTGPEEENYRLQITGYRLLDKVTFLSWVDHQRMPELLASCDIFCYPSISYQGSEEQFGYAMAEAMLMEKPVIATSTGAIEGVVKNEKNGIIVPQKDILKLSESMLKLAKSENLRQQYGETGRQFIISNFSQQIIARKFFQFFSAIGRSAF